MIPYKGNVIIILKNSSKNNNIKLLRIKYTEFNNIENILQASI